MTSAFMSMKLVGAIFVVLQLDLLLSNYFGAAAAKHVGSGGCIAKERRALLKLKASLVLNGTHLLSTWDIKSDCCSWKGVECSNQTGHVEMLNLNGRQFGHFRGKINASLMELRHLKYLNFSNQNLSSNNFLQFVGSLNNLRVLDLQGSFLGGRIPNDFARLSHLQYLDLSFNNLKGEIPHKLENISHLKHLDLSSNNLVGSIPRGIGNISHLQHLDLSNNKLAGIIPHQFGRLSNLQHLDLSGNYNLVGTIPHQFGRLINLRELNLEYNYRLRVHDTNNRVGGEWLSNLTLLTHLSLSGVQSVNSSHVLLKMICKLPKIEELKLASCHIKDFFLSQSISNTSFGDICTLQSLDVGENYLNEDITIILSKLSGCARYSLQDLWLDGNQITGTFPDLSIFPHLKSIGLSYNMLSGKVPDGDFPSKLETLRFGDNSLEGGIPKSFGNLCSLKSLDLSRNKLSEYFPAILHNLSVGCAKYSLQELDLTSNQIFGTVLDMSNFSSLETLFLSDNLLYGNIPRKSSFPYQLDHLYLDSNNLDGVITDSHFGNMSMLKNLNLSDNSLALMFSEKWVPSFQLYTIGLRSCILGPSFPKWIRSQKTLLEVDISNAGISDIVPVWFWTEAANIRFINISCNNLFGTIPNLPITFSIGSEVIMDSNNFKGSIPPFFRSATLLQSSMNKFSETRLLLCTNSPIDRLRILDLSKNRLSRQLPDCWNHLNALEFLDLSSNTLSGEVPSSIGSLRKLRALILRNNTFGGKLPVSLKNCREMILLDLGDNRLSGPIPFWLGQQLQMLSLRRNQFSGSLPLSLCDLTNIQLLDLSENNLSGRIFKCLKNFSAMSKIVSSTRTIDDTLYYPIGSGIGIGYNGYDLVALLMWKGAERLFKNNELILRSIDLSSNQLIGDIPEEIGNLIELVSLNLSSNNLTGEITSKIGRLTSLEFLDLSRNHLCCSIPPSLAQINRLTMLYLSNNNLSGKIPIGTQLQSFEASSYEGNVGLCGKPLDKICPGDEEVAHQKPETPEESSPGDKKSIYLSVALGFITGFWGLWGSLLLIRTWRHKYVLFLNNIIDIMYVFMVLNATKFQRWLRG